MRDRHLQEGDRRQLSSPGALGLRVDAARVVRRAAGCLMTGTSRMGLVAPARGRGRAVAAAGVSR